MLPDAVYHCTIDQIVYVGWCLEWGGVSSRRCGYVAVVMGVDICRVGMASMTHWVH